jgi:hypothetical protein
LPGIGIRNTNKTNIDTQPFSFPWKPSSSLIPKRKRYNL